MNEDRILEPVEALEMSRRLDQVEETARMALAAKLDIAPEWSMSNVQMSNGSGSP